ncbi:UNVERIFIED_CONTAM: hypothetical protein HDU68_009966 [Siphonaria sp. JEL0065]|nr:hypothetical protein HDU68_009966 [Siphonaria sp. JEL0065]
MPQIKFDGHVLFIVVSMTERLLSVTTESEIKIEFSQIKGVRTRPAEAYKWIKGLKVGTDLPRVATDAVYHHTGGQKPDLHLYSKCEQTVAIDLDSHYYGVIIFQVPDQTPYAVALKIQQEVGLSGAIRDDQDDAK